MTMYDKFDKDDKKKIKYTTLECYECGKYGGLYFREKPTFFKELFFCSLKCQDDHQKKKKVK